MSASIRKIKTVPDDPTINRILQDKKKRIRLFLLLSGILLIGLGFYPTGTVVTNSQQMQNSNEVTSFSQEPVSIDKNLFNSLKGRDKIKSSPIRIIIPELNIDIPVKEAKVVNGFWEVFPDVAGFGTGSAYPDEAGNQVIFAHARKGLFLSLKDAKVGEMIYIFTKERRFTYKIVDIKEVLPSQTEVIASTNTAILTLYTCSGFADSKRLIVKASKIE